MYFSSENTSNTDSLLCIDRVKQTIKGDYNSWGKKELVFSPGTVAGSKASVAGLGESTLTEWGDISFVAVLYSYGTNDVTDQFKTDLCYLPRLDPIGLSRKEVQKRPLLFPNPAIGIISVRILNLPFSYQIADIPGSSHLIDVDVYDPVIDIILYSPVFIIFIFRMKKTVTFFNSSKTNANLV